MNPRPLTISYGRNVWILARTDRDGPTPDAVVSDAVRWIWELLGGIAGFQPFQAPGGPDWAARYYIDNARPSDIAAMQGDDADPRRHLPHGLERWSSNDLPPGYGVDAEKPWFVIWDFDWRGPAVQFEKWPTRTLKLWLYPDTDPDLKADWLLLEAVHVSDKAERPDSTWTDEVLQRGKTVAAGGLGVAGLLLVAYVLFATGGLSSRKR